MDDAYIVLGVNIKGMAVVFGGDDIDELIAMASPLLFYSVYRNEPGFHASSQKRFLVMHHNDPFWLMSGDNGGIVQ